MKKQTAKRIYPLVGVLISCGTWVLPVRAQPSPDIAQITSQPQASSDGPIALPSPLPAPPTVAPPDEGQYVLEFNRSPVVGNRLKLESIYDEARLRFTRPRNWKPKTVKVLLRYRHSPALYASRSNLTVLMNGTSVGSVPLNQPDAKIGSAVFNVPADLIQDYNEVTIAALQNNSPTCTQDPYDPSLWSEIMPDSKIVFDFQPQPITLNFSQYPYPIFDTLSLEANQVAYLLPKTIDDTWLTASTRLQTALGRVADYRAMDTRLVKTLDQAKQGDRLLIIGTPSTQPALAGLNLPLPIKNNQLVDGKQQPLPPDRGVLMLATTGDNHIPVLIATGNGAAGVAKAVQFLTQTHDRQIGTGSVVLVNQVENVPSPPPRQWARYLPDANQFNLSDLKDFNNQAYQDVSVRGSHAPALEFDFRALPDDQFLPGGSMTLNFSYGPQVNPLTSLVEVALDGVPLGGKRLTSVNGMDRDSVHIELPQDRIKPNSKMQINFRLDPREQRSCSRVTDQQLWGTIHATTSFDLKRDQVARIPDLKLVQSAYPFAAPQDLSETTIVMPNQPTASDVLLMLEISERLGRLSRSDAVQLEAYRVNSLPAADRDTHHLIAIGTQSEFPLPKAFEANGFALQKLLARKWQQNSVQTLPDTQGVLKEIVSPWNADRVLLALTAQTTAGLDQVRDLISQDSLFYQIEGDTVLVNANTENPSPYDAKDYNLEFLRQSPQHEISDASFPDQIIRMLRGNWFVLAPGLVAAALILYGITQLYLKKLTGQAR